MFVSLAKTIITRPRGWAARHVKPLGSPSPHRLREGWFSSLIWQMKTLRFREVKQLVQCHTVNCQSRGQNCHFGTSLPPWGPSLPRTSSQGIFSAGFSQLSSLKRGMTKPSLEFRSLLKCQVPLGAQPPPFCPGPRPCVMVDPKRRAKSLGISCPLS